ncbi:hypothetical protein L207DRAFT_636133 [Hyaloscypha variabilis F]|uniref:2EXR domain-containing protein n=1 Tax=Hyaloscypha variabilis (strain UAMH 11265 / GT02V1 / F) TaxID=1149755 RepID=A0A2J6RG11_HYAVF|nr:hypothetical protein L207DRAFT_636133 [Hyaloscypha variabilis F]
MVDSMEDVGIALSTALPFDDQPNYNLLGFSDIRLEVHPFKLNNEDGQWVTSNDFLSMIPSLENSLRDTAVYFPDKLSHENPASASPSSDSSFTCFPRLPVELRIKIWRLAIPRVRFLQVRAHYDPTTMVIRFSACDKQLSVSVLRTSRESREAYLEVFPIRLPALNPHQEIRFDPKLDFIYISNFEHLRPAFESRVGLSLINQFDGSLPPFLKPLSTISRLALPANSFCDDGSLSPHLQNPLEETDIDKFTDEEQYMYRNFPLKFVAELANVKTLALVLDPNNYWPEFSYEEMLFWEAEGEVDRLRELAKESKYMEGRELPEFVMVAPEHWANAIRHDSYSDFGGNEDLDECYDSL